jgi:hypothetical protein
MYNDLNFLAMPSQRFIDRVIDGFKNHVMQARTVIGITNVHPGPFTDSI